MGQPFSRKIKALIKRCEQDNEVRDVEDKIIKRMKLREKTWTQDYNGRKPVLVFCVNASGIGTDIENALRGVSNHRPVLVVLHCTNPSSLRGDLSDDDYLLDQALRDRVTGIAHFAFSEIDRFYACRQNNDGYRKLIDLLSRVTESLETIRHSWLIKKCEQDNPGVRHVEDKIIHKRKKLRKAADWTEELADNGRTPVVVFCVNASRIGTDIESALRGVGEQSPVVLVVLHCKNPSSLRGDLSDDDYLLDQALRDRVTGIVHFAFSESDGFYSCRQNKDGKMKLKSKLKDLTP